METNEKQHSADSSTLAEAADAVRKLAAVLDDHHLSQIEVSLGKLHIRLKAGKTGEPADAAPAIKEVAAAALAAGEVGHVVTAPMIGTFYAASAPGEPAFVKVGDEVEAGQQIGIIEAMKIMNEIAADKSGVVVEILVENAQAVEYGSPLVRISTSARLD